MSRKTKIAAKKEWSEKLVCSFNEVLAPVRNDDHEIDWVLGKTETFHIRNKKTGKLEATGSGGDTLSAAIATMTEYNKTKQTNANS